MQPKCNSLFFHQMESITLKLTDAFVHNQLAHLHSVSQQSWGEGAITHWNINPDPNSSLNPNTNSNFNPNPKHNPYSRPKPKPNPTLILTPALTSTLTSTPTLTLTNYYGESPAVP